MKTFRIVLLNGTKIDIEAEKLEIASHKLLGKCILTSTDPLTKRYLPLVHIAEFTEDDTGAKKEKIRKRLEEVDYQNNKHEGESKKDFIKRTRV